MKKHLKTIFKPLLLMALVFTVGCEADDEAFAEVAIGGADVESAYPLESVTLTGENFDQVQFVFVGNRQASFQLEGESLTFQVPEGAPIGETTVTLAMVDNVRVTMPFVVLQRPNPVIERISPSAAQAGETVNITGVNLDNLESITFGGVEAEVVSNTATEMVVTVPDGLPQNTVAPIEVVTAGGEFASPSIFYVGENLIQNGTLEEGEGDEFTNWGKYNGAEGLTATTDPSEAYYGRSLRAVAVGGDAWRTQFVSDAAPTQVGTEYTLTVWIRAEAGTPGDGGSIRFSTTPDPQYSADYEVSSEWQQIQWTFTANVDATQIALDLGFTQDAVYFIDNVTLIATGQAGPQPVEVLLNGGFEEGEGDEFTNWGKYNGADLLTSTTVEGEIRSGDRALRAEVAGTNEWDTQLGSDQFPTEVGTDYTVKMWIKAEAGSPGVGGSVRLSTQSPSGDAMYGPNLTVTEEWQLYEWTFTANDVATSVFLDLGGTVGAVYFIDDISVEAPPAEPIQDIAPNGGFEEGDGDEFTDWEKLNGAELMTATTEEAEVYSGSRALRVEAAGGDPWSTQLASTAVPTEVGVTYKVSMWIRAEDGAGVGGVVRFSTQSPTGDAMYGPDFTVSADWQEYEWTFTANDELTRIVLDMGATAEAVYFIDEVTVMEQQD